MPIYTVLVNPTPEHIKQITALYRSAGWWAKETDEPRQVEGIISGSFIGRTDSLTADSAVSSGFAFRAMG